MKYVQAQAGTYLRTLDGATLVQWDVTHYCKPGALTPDEAVQFEVTPLQPTTPPAFDRLTEGLREADPELVYAVWQQRWEVYPLPDEAAQAAQADAVAAQHAALWRAADAWQNQFISGVAIGLLTIGVLQALPKALAVQAWSGALWSDYYARKATVTPYTDVSCDFSSAGPMPHTVPELRAELGL